MTKPANSPPGPGKGKGPRKPWHEAEIIMLRQHYADTPTALLAQVFERPVQHLYAQAGRLGLLKSDSFLMTSASGRLGHFGGRGTGTRFQPGLVPWNKGKSHTAGGRSGETRFGPGNRPHTWVPVGSHRVTPDGYLERKIGDDPGPYTRRWLGVHRIVWAEAHGDVPAGHVVVFRPGRHSTDLALITLDALECITRRDLMKRNSVHTIYPPELARLAQLRGVLTRRINECLKEGTTP